MVVTPVSIGIEKRRWQIESRQSMRNGEQRRMNEASEKQYSAELIRLVRRIHG
jgi:hypothetical protein